MPSRKVTVPVGWPPAGETTLTEKLTDSPGSIELGVPDSTVTLAPGRMWVTSENVLFAELLSVLEQRDGCRVRDIAGDGRFDRNEGLNAISGARAPTNTLATPPEMLRPLLESRLMKSGAGGQGVGEVDSGRDTRAVVRDRDRVEDLVAELVGARLRAHRDGQVGVERAGATVVWNVSCCLWSWDRAQIHSHWPSRSMRPRRWASR